MKKMLSRASNAFTNVLTGFFGASEVVETKTEQTAQASECPNVVEMPHLSEAFQKKIDSGETVRLNGIVKWFNSYKNYGFVKLSGVDYDAFVHVSAIQTKYGRYDRVLSDGQLVQVDVNKCPDNGRIRVVRCLRLTGDDAVKAFNELDKKAA